MSKIFPIWLCLVASSFAQIQVPDFNSAESAPEVVASLLSEHETITPGEPFHLALKLKIKPQWHTYWKNSGGVELPPSIELSLPDGFTAGPLQFPYPKKFMTLWDTVSYGYMDEVVHPLLITPPSKLPLGETISISGTARWQVCHDICIPGEKKFELEFTVAESIEGESNPEIAQALSKLPTDAPEGTTLSVSIDGELVSAVIEFPEGQIPTVTDDLRLFPLTKELFGDSPEPAQAISFEGSTMTVVSPKHRDLENVPESPAFVLANKDGSIAMSIPAENETSEASVSDAGTPNVAADSSTGFLATLFAGLLGGLILNVMPCVFPVISLKIMSFASHAGDDRKKIAFHGIVFSLGILVFFWVLTGILIGLRSFGNEAGWAFQFQSPVFVMVMTAVMVLLALNLFGVFEMGTSMTGIGGKLTTSSGYSGSFWSGALATLLATPCSGPFLGTAIFTALTWSPIKTIIFFTVMGLGMSIPYLLISVFPNLISKLPRPGAWMETFKQAMGFPMLAAAIWLIYVLVAIIGDEGLTVFLLGLVALSVAAWAWGRFNVPGASNGKRLAGKITAAVFVISAFWVSASASNFRPEPTGEDRDIAELIAEHQAEGKGVFVDFTARWCGICQSNKIAIHSEAVEKALEDANVEFVIADYSDYDPRIKAILDKYERGSVPFYPIFSADPNAEPVILPQTLTVGTILDGLNKL